MAKHIIAIFRLTFLFKYIQIKYNLQIKYNTNKLLDIIKKIPVSIFAETKLQ